MIRKLNKKGFTIMELMIATAVFSVLLLIASGVIVQLSRQFYKGLIQSKTQEVARNIGEEIARNIQFSSTAPQLLSSTAESEVWCIADRRYLFVRGRQLGTDSNQSPSVAVRTDLGCGGDPSMSSGYTLAAGDVEMVGEKMRLSDMTIEQGPNDKVWSVTVRVLHADDGQVCETGTAKCNNEQVNTNAELLSRNLSCRNMPGSQFCGASTYSMVVVRRL